MATDCIPQLTFRFQENSKPVVATFDMAHASSDGGAVLLKSLDARLKLTEQMASCLTDQRQPGKVQHELLELVRQRVFGLACGYPDGNDAARLADDPIHKLLVGRDPLSGPALASQPTLSRFENQMGRKDLYRLSLALADRVIVHHRRRLKGKARRITIDLDPTDDPTHGQQEFTFFNGHYDTWCYLPVVATVSFDKEPEQYLVGVVLRPGNASAKQGAIGILRRLLSKLRTAFPRARLRVRLDGGFQDNGIMDFLEAEGVEYLMALASNARLEKRARRLLGTARRLSRETGQSAQLYGETRYAAQKWSHKRRVILKAEVVRHPGRDPRDNPRFVVTNLPYKPETVYGIYRQRGDAENRYKELHAGLELDRTSCHRFLANQFRVLLTAMAYVLLQELRRQARGTDCADAQVSTLRERLFKLAVWVERSVRRIVLHLPVSFPWLRSWRQIACAVGASPG
ncbi:MAG: IS1380 family transposase [Candidatus Tectomicrobia bacterium]|uniref:IS1380 family transposase n=1 Tax=Tectimicrobiota bacterium TaxID=2528274 RepID=A0A932M1P3_UNCTE|nr:IS1380 family transposase [Candidatus Tectomicrobia bacterium]